MAETKATHSHMVDGNAVPCSRPLFGPFGDRAIHGTLQEYKSAKSDPNKREDDDKLLHDAWCFTYYTPATIQEVQKFAQNKPELVRELVAKALHTAASQAAWRENRGGTASEYVSINGRPAARVAKELLDLLKAAGHKVVLVQRKSKNTPTK